MSSEEGARKPRILVIDDDPGIRFILQYALEGRGMEVLMAPDGDEGVAMASQDVDLVLCDMMMPKMGGLEVCRHLRGEEATRGIPIIMLTAKTQEEDLVQAFELGADDYVVKPFSPNELVARVERSLQRREDRESSSGSSFL